MHILLLIIVLLALVLGPGIWVKRVLQRYQQPEDRYSLSGGEVARKLLDEHGLNGVGVEGTDQGDHYDPSAKVVRLGEAHLRGRSLAAVTIAAHEVGHALQDAQRYSPLVWRTRLVRWAEPIQKTGAALLMFSPIVGAVTRAPAIAGLAFLGGFLTLATGTVVHFVTLPSEFDASFNRALPLLARRKLLHAGDEPHARKLLTAAALTYVAASLMSLLNIARWWAILRR